MNGVTTMNAYNGTVRDSVDSHNNEIVLRAQEAVTKYPNSDIEIGMAFCPNALIDHTIESNDRLIKLGRRIKFLVNQYSAVNSTANTKNIDLLRKGLSLLMEECNIIIEVNHMDSTFRVPKVKFGKTDIQISIITLGCMRFQQEWGPRITCMNEIHSDCHGNLVAILYTAIKKYGINHIETARGYGCSEIQLGIALQQLYKMTNITRSDLIIQTKVPPMSDIVAFRETIETSMKHLQISYIDLFALHGMNYEEQYEYVFGQNGRNCMSILHEYIAAGKIKHIGFSTHGSTDFICKCIETNVFEYINVHYHYFGSYTASGCNNSEGNKKCIELATSKNMGIFIISPFDKGGRLYTPSKQLVSLLLPNNYLDPIIFQSHWIWNHHNIVSSSDNTDCSLQLHTYTVGAARVSDLDQPIVAAYLFDQYRSRTLEYIKNAMTQLDHHKEQALGNDWIQSWYVGLPKNTQSKSRIEHNQIIWLYNCIVAFGMYEFSKARYKSFENNNSKWDSSKTDDENINTIGINSWGFVPGRPLQLNIVEHYSKDDLVNVPTINIQRIVEAEEFVYHYCRDRSLDSKDTNNSNNPKKLKLTKPLNFLRRLNLQSSTTKPKSSLTEGSSNSVDVATGVVEEDSSSDNIVIPDEWQTAYDLRPWPDYPDRPSRA